MHIPGHVLDPATAISTGLAATAAVGYSLYRVRTDGRMHNPSLVGVTAACIFAVQSLNFPLPGGTSGHLLGGVLAGIVLGPWAGILTVAAVLVVQCFLFGDGGASALGANVLNMAVVGSGLGYGIYYALKRSAPGIQGSLFGAAVASWTSAVLGATICAVELSLGGQYVLGPALAAMVPPHALIGIGEAAVTVSALAVLLNLRADYRYGFSIEPTGTRSSKRSLIAGFVTALVMAAAVSPFASQLPDALQALMSTHAVDGDVSAAIAWVPFANLDLLGVPHLLTAAPMVAMLGTAAAFLLAHGLFYAALRLRGTGSGFEEQVSNNSA